RAEAGPAAHARPPPAGTRAGARSAAIRGGADALPGSPAGTMARRADRPAAARAAVHGDRRRPGGQPARSVRRAPRPVVEGRGRSRGRCPLIDDPTLFAAPLAA